MVVVLLSEAVRTRNGWIAGASAASARRGPSADSHGTSRTTRQVALNLNPNLHLNLHLNLNVHLNLGLTCNLNLNLILHAWVG